MSIAASQRKGVKWGRLSPQPRGTSTRLGVGVSIIVAQGTPKIISGPSIILASQKKGTIVGLGEDVSKYSSRLNKQSADVCLISLVVDQLQLPLIVDQLCTLSPERNSKKSYHVEKKTVRFLTCVKLASISSSVQLREIVNWGFYRLSSSVSIMSSLLKMTYQNKQITNAQCSTAPHVHCMLALIKIENNSFFDILNTLILIYFFVLLTD